MNLKTVHTSAEMQIRNLLMNEITGLEKLWIPRNDENGHKILDLNLVREELQKNQLSYSQCLQDVFALVVNDYEFSGTCLDIGSAGPNIDGVMNNNTLLLQLYNWKSVNVDIGDFSEDWEPYPNASYLSLIHI